MCQYQISPAHNITGLYIWQIVILGLMATKSAIFILRTYLPIIYFSTDIKAYYILISTSTPDGKFRLIMASIVFGVGFITSIKRL